MISMNFGLSPAQWLASLVLLILLLGVGSQDPDRLTAAAQPKPVVLPLRSFSGLRSTTAEATPIASLSATSVYVLTQENGEIVFEHNSNTDYAPASTTKLMTALVARQIFPLNQVLTVPAVNFPDDRQPLTVGATYTVKELLAALLVSSNNTAAYTLASAHPQGYSGFVDEMNNTAKVMGLTNSYFTNPAGFDDPSHRSTARDLGQLFRAAMTDPLLAELLSRTEWILTRADGSPVGALKNTHQLLGTDERARAGKTGTTNEAKQVLITLLETDGHPYILVVLGSTDRYAETRRLADWVDRRYTWQQVSPVLLLKQNGTLTKP